MDEKPNPPGEKKPSNPTGVWLAVGAGIEAAIGAAIGVALDAAQNQTK